MKPIMIAGVHVQRVSPSRPSSTFGSAPARAVESQDRDVSASPGSTAKLGLS